MSFYDQGQVSPQEMQREKLSEHPNFVSRKLLGEVDLANAKVLDAGCGSNPGMLEYVCGQSGFYTGLDLLPQKLGELQSAVNGKSYRYKLMNFDLTAGSLPIENKAFDYAHMRFVLMHLADPAAHAAVIREVLRVTKKTAWFLEWDWNSASVFRPGKERDDQDAVIFAQRFLDVSLRLMEMLKIHPSVGKFLPYLGLLDEIGQFGKVEYQVHQRPWGDYSEEVIPLCRTQAVAAQALSSSGSFGQKEIVWRLVRELCNLEKHFSEHGAWLKPPDICVAVVHKKSMV